jgi:hypothetical protein
MRGPIKQGVFFYLKKTLTTNTWSVNYRNLVDIGTPYCIYTALLQTLVVPISEINNSI